jgi:hypothetical protein
MLWFVVDFSCACQGNTDHILRHGRMFITEHYICFSSHILGVYLVCYTHARRDRDIDRVRERERERERGLSSCTLVLIYSMPYSRKYWHSDIFQASRRRIRHLCSRMPSKQQWTMEPRYVGSSIAAIDKHRVKCARY